MPYTPAFTKNTRPTWAPRTTSKKAKNEYKRHGPRLSSQEARQLDRQIELENRASKIRNADDRKRANARKKAEKDEKQRLVQKNGVVVFGSRYSASSQGSLEGFIKRSTRSDAGDVEHKCSVESKNPSGVQRSDKEGSVPTEESEPTTQLSFQSPNNGSKRKRSPETIRSSQKRPKLAILDDIALFDDFDITNSQISRELSKGYPKSKEMEPPFESSNTSRTHQDYAPVPQDTFLDMLSTQDVSLSAEDVEELAPSCKVKQSKRVLDDPPKITALQKKAEERMLMPPPRIPFKPVRPTRSLSDLPLKNSPRLRPRPPLSTLATNNRTSIPSKKPPYELDSLTLSDFDLSSQDNRDIFG